MDFMRKNFAFLLFLSLMVSPVALAGPAAPIVVIDGAYYVPLSFFSETPGLEYRWDALLKNVTVASRSGSVKFHIGSEYILNRGKVIKLKDKVRFFKGSIVAPLPAKEYLESLLMPEDLVSIPNAKEEVGTQKNVVGSAGPAYAVLPPPIPA